MLGVTASLGLHLWHLIGGAMALATASQWQFAALNARRTLL
ncbi:MAG: hypothetical protein UU76_C0024G0005 [Parcubacteria group bacterium GW2011_GWC1_41_7]|nr:MAG: hypothetical protein UU76_C0024G0005 [Parcubacteria group bacterium GW2011_GWC1_41_7]